MRDYAHAMRSSAAHVGARRIQKICGFFCHAPRHEVEQAMVEKARQLVEEFDRFRTAVRQHLRERTAARRPNAALDAHPVMTDRRRCPIAPPCRPIVAGSLIASARPG